MVVKTQEHTFSCELRRLHQNPRSPETLRAERPQPCRRDGEALKCRWRGLSTVTCMKHFNSCRWNEPFQEAHCDAYRPTRQIGDDCSIVAVSYWEQGIHPLSDRRLLSHLANETPPHPLTTTPSPPPHPLNLLSWFRITVQRHGLLVQLLLPLLPVRRGATAIFASMQLLDCCCIRSHDSILHVLGCAVWGLQPMLMCAHFSLLHLDFSTGFDMPIKRR